MSETATALRAAVERGFRAAPFMVHLGVAVRDCGSGWVETVLELAPEFKQHTGVAHAGALAALGDHSAGAAAMTLLSAARSVVTVEFKINLLRAARAKTLVCRATVIKPGRRLMAAESRIYESDGVDETLVATLSATLAVIDIDDPESLGALQGAAA